MKVGDIIKFYYNDYDQDIGEVVSVKEAEKQFRSGHRIFIVEVSCLGEARTECFYREVFHGQLGSRWYAETEGFNFISYEEVEVLTPSRLQEEIKEVQAEIKILRGREEYLQTLVGKFTAPVD